jgi:hypothetical protein
VRNTKAGIGWFRVGRNSGGVLEALCRGLPTVVLLSSCALWARQGQATQSTPKSTKQSASHNTSASQQQGQSNTNQTQQYSISVSISKNAQQQKQTSKKATQPASLNLNIVMTCRISTGECTNKSFTVPRYVVPDENDEKACSALKRALVDKQAVLASLAQFLATNLMQQPPYSLAAAGDTLIFLTSSQPNSSANSPKKTEKPATDPKLTALVQEIQGYLTPLEDDPSLIPPLRVEFSLPEANLLGSDAATELANAAGTDFSVKPLTGTRVTVSSNSPYPITCDQWTNFFTQAGEIARSAYQESPVYRTYHIDAGDAAAALSATAMTRSSVGPNSNRANPTEASPSNTSNESAGAEGSSNSGQQAMQKSASNNVSSNANSSPQNAQATPSSAPAAPSTAATSFPLGSPGDDLVIFPGTSDGAEIAEKQRILAAMDLPRPQMLINGWAFQNSSKNVRTSVEFRNQVTNFVNEQNDELQNAILTGWRNVNDEIGAKGAQSTFFDADFTDYIRKRKVYSPIQENIRHPDALAGTVGGLGEMIAQPNPDDRNLCDLGQYCLGYTELFSHPQPRLTDLLLTFIAAKDPRTAVDDAVGCVEFRSCTRSSPLPPTREQGDLARILSPIREYGTPSCDQRDLLGINDYASDRAQPRLFLECFREQADVLLDPTVRFLGLIRAAVADFLFNYKMSQMYPHEFSAYDLTQSASALDTAVEPLIDAFNRDVAAFQIYWQSRIIYETKRDVKGTNLSYTGVISVRTVSGNNTSARTTSQSFLNTSQAPELSTLLSNLGGASASPTGVLAGLSGKEVQVLAAALQTYQTTEAQIGRSLSIRVQPRSLANASSAEMDVTFDADESAAPTRWSNSAVGNASALDLSRIASSDVTTHVRVDSLKLFEISSTAAIVRAGREKFPLVPPGVEIPYIGTLVGFPLNPAESFQTSTAILSAVVMPTATDLANGLRFRADLVLERLDAPKNSQSCNLTFDPKDSGAHLCRVRNAVSMNDLGGLSRLREYNREMVECYASGRIDCYDDPKNGLTFPKILAAGS